MRRKTLLTGVAATLTMLFGDASAMAADAVYGGTTSAGEAIVVNADKAGKKLRSAVIGWRARCSDGQGFPQGSALTVVQSSPGFSPGPDDLAMSRNGNRRFAGTQVNAVGSGEWVAAVTVRLDGRLGVRAASGSLSAEVKILDRATGNERASCSTGRMRWKATRAPGRVYAGKTSQDLPVVARVDAKRKRITDLLVSWQSSNCQPEAFIQYAESLRNFRVASTGRFGDSWDSSEPTSDGETARSTYALDGRLARRAARGTLRIGVTWADGAGATTQSCDSGSVTWKAITG